MEGELEILHEDRDVGSRRAVVTVATDQTSYTRTQSVSIKATIRSGGRASRQCCCKLHRQKFERSSRDGDRDHREQWRRRLQAPADEERSGRNYEADAAALSATAATNFMVQ